MTRQFLCGLLFALTLTGISAASAQSINQQSIQQQLQQGTLFLRGRYVCTIPTAVRTKVTTPQKHGKQPRVIYSTRKGSTSCDLSFDSQGKLNTPAEKGPLALSAVQIDRVQFESMAVVLQTERWLIVKEDSASEPSTIQLQPPAHLQITIALNPAQPETLQAALKTIFSPSLAQSLSAETPQKRDIDLASLPVLAIQPGQKPKASPYPIGLPHKGAAMLTDSESHLPITAPSPAYLAEPQYTRQARKHKIQGTCDIQLIVSKDGFPEHIRIIKSLSDGLDQRAIAAVSQYRFHPATKNGKPVAVQLAVVVKFHLFHRIW